MYKGVVIEAAAINWSRRWRWIGIQYCGCYSFQCMKLVYIGNLLRCRLRIYILNYRRDPGAFASFMSLSNQILEKTVHEMTNKEAFP